MLPTYRAVRPALFALVLGATLVAVPTASALNVSRNGNVIVIEAAAGEDNNVTVLESGANLRVTEGNNGATATIVPGAGCANSVANSVDCGATATVTSLTANLGDLDDAYSGNLAVGTTFPHTIDFGPGRDGGNAHRGNDTLIGGPGNDSTLDGDEGNDLIDGGIGNDGLQGDLGDDTLTGGEGGDSLNDVDGANTYDGGDGDDSFSWGSGVGVDRMLGGAGNDNFSSSNSTVGPDVFDGGPGRDTASFFSEGAPLTITLDDVANDLAAGQGANVLGMESVSGGAGNDIIVGSGAPESMSGGSGTDAMNGGGGNDELFGNGDNDSLLGGDGNDGLYGDSADDSMDGGAGTDLLYGGDGADDLVGGTGRDTVDWGGGSAYRGVTVTLDNVADDGAAGEGDNAHSDNENIVGTGGPDVLFGSPGPNTISGGNGYDTIITREGGPAAASRDTALCGNDEDTVVADPTDVLGSGAEHCELVSYGDVTGYGPLVGVTASGGGAGQSGVLPLVLRCPLSARGGCEGTTTLTVGGRRAGRVRFSMRPGQEVERDMKLSRRAVRAINRSAKRVRGTLRTQAEDELGATRTSTKRVNLTK